MQADKTVVTRLLKTASGQLEGIRAMVEDDRYCMDISNQLLATTSILRKVNREVLKAHLNVCVREAIATGDSSKIEEILALVDKL